MICRSDGGGHPAGAVFGRHFKSRRTCRAIHHNRRCGREPRCCSLRPPLKTGDLHGVDLCCREIPDALDPFDRAAFRRYPAVAAAMAVRHERYSEQARHIHEWDAASALLVIRPESNPGISRTEGDPDEPERVYRLGRAQDKERLEAAGAYPRRDG